MGPWTGSLAWLWWGRSLPKGNQWESWDPRLGPNVVRFPVHLPSPMPSDAPYDPNLLLTPEPYTPATPMPPDTPTPLPSPDVPTPLIPCVSLSPTPPAMPQWPWHPTFPASPNTPTSLMAPNAPHPCLWKCWDPALVPNVVGLSVHLPPQCPLTPSTPPLSPQHPLHPCWPLMPLTPASGNAGTLDWDPMYLGSQSTCHPNAPTPPASLWHPLPVPWLPPDAPRTGI